MNIISTGTSGFVGTNLVSYLKEKSDFDIKTLILRDDWNITHLESFDCIIHLAGKAHDLKNTTNAEEYYQVNTELTKKLYDAFLKSNAKKFIFISSVKAAADSVESILTEDAKPLPQTHYGKSKLLAEQYIQSQTLPAGKSYYILRPCMIHGPGNKGNLNLLYNFVKKGIPYPLAAFENKRSFLSVENLCFVIKELLDQNVPSGIYNIADDESLSTTELVMEIALNLGLKPKLWHIYPAIIEGIAKVGEALKLPLNPERLTKLTQSYQVSNLKIIRAIGKVLPFSARQGLTKTLRSFTTRDF
ncbi:MAG TPA: NAD-dependent epimerase/dehydratase family protein [Pedobacter sp.]|jgi:nucleoside-diphosphate-sugar epimerase